MARQFAKEKRPREERVPRFSQANNWLKQGKNEHTRDRGLIRFRTNSMKIFWAVFFAILAAAAVIWGISNVAEARSKQREFDLKVAKEAVNQVREMASAAEVGTEIPEYLFTTLDIRLELLRSAVRKEGSRLQFEKDTFIRDGRDLVAALQKQSVRKEWVQKFSMELDTFEREH